MKEANARFITQRRKNDETTESPRDRRGKYGTQKEREKKRASKESTGFHGKVSFKWVPFARRTSAQDETRMRACLFSEAR